MDAFFAAIEQRDNPALRGKPILVGGTGPRGVVSTASYEARPYGCRSAMPMSRALAMCPHAIVVPVNGKRIREASQQVFTILGEFTDRVQPVSVDEAFLDVTGCERLLGDGEQIARDIRRRIAAETRLTASVGVAPNKFLAKLASDLNKPDGLTVITRDTVDQILPPLSVRRIWGIGPKAAAKLESLGVKTIGDLQARSGDFLNRMLGSWGDRVNELIHGIDERPVESDDTAKSIGQEETFGVDLIEKEHLRFVLLEQAEAVGARMRRQGLLAGNVTVKIRFGDFKTVTRSRQLTTPTDTTQDLYDAATALFDRWADEHFQPVRLIGLQASSFSKTAQLDLFEQPRRERQKRVDSAVDAIKTRFGKTAIRRGQSMNEP
jgi:DNA polymerase-4